MDRLKELVEITRQIDKLEVRKSVLKEEALSNLLGGDAEKVVLDDQSKVYVSHRKVNTKKTPMEERVDPQLINLYKKPLYALQKEAFFNNLKALTLMVPNAKRLTSPDLAAPTKPILMVTPKKTSLNASFERVKVKEGHKRKTVKTFLELYHYGEKYGSMDLEQAWTIYLNG